MRLGVVYEPRSANAFYRAVFPLQALARRGHTVIWPTDVDELPMKDFLGCDLVHFYRRTDRLDDLRRLSERGVAIGFDNDDNYAAAETSDIGSGLDGLRRNKRIVREIVKAVRLSDLTTTPSAELAEQYRSEGARNVLVVENRLERSMFGFGSRSRHKGVVVGWVAGSEHASDLERIPIADVLGRLLEAHPQMQLVTVGVQLPLRSVRYRHVPEVQFLDLLKVTSGIDIGIAPLADTPFNRSRSDVKLKEYASGGAAWLASPVGPYRGLGEAEGGTLVDDEGWYSALDTLIAKSRMRKRLSRRALAWAKAQAIDNHAQVWELAFEQAIENREALAS
jgi:hypothetical protein